MITTKMKPVFAAALLLSAGALMGCNNLTGSSDATADDDAGGVSIDDPPELGQSPPTKSLKCAYPIGDFGVGNGKIIPITHQWDGWIPGSDQPGTLHVSDLYDCDGSLGINAILFDTSQFG